MKILVKTDITHTIGAEFGSKVINVNHKNVKLQIWDVSVIYFRCFFVLLNNDSSRLFFRQQAKSVFDP